MDPEPTRGLRARLNDSSREVAVAAATAAVDAKANDVVVLALKELTILADYFVICSGSSAAHVKAIADRILDTVDGVKHVEGYDRARWVLIDLGDVVVHVMQPLERRTYDLERLWGEAPLERY